MENKFEGYRQILEKFEAEKRLRSIPPDRTEGGRIDLSSNDYLGLDSIATELYNDFWAQNGASMSSSASRLLASKQSEHSALEKLLEELYGKPALLFNSGYHANTGTISALNIPGTIFLTDKLIHASIIDGLSMCKAECARWKHNDLSHLRRLLQKHEKSSERMIVVAESIYSMDGDIVPLEGLIELKREFPSMILYLDEAHAFGVRGEHGLGMAEEFDLISEVDLLIGTFGKACHSSGAFVIASPLIRSYLLNTARSFIFSTAIPPANASWTRYMIEKIYKMTGERQKLNEISKDFRNFISEITGTANPSQSQIVPLLVGDAEKALKIARDLDKEGIDALAIRRPTVPPGGERIRFSLNASLSADELNKIKKAIRKVLLKNENQFS